MFRWGKSSERTDYSPSHLFVLVLLPQKENHVLRLNRLGALYREVVAVRLSGRNVFLPDLAFYRTGREDVIRPTHIVAAPDLVVEVLSPRTADRDIGPKFAEYEQHGVREYWILDPETLAHRFYHLIGEELVEYADGSNTIDSTVVTGFFLNRSWLDPADLPRIDDALGIIEAGG
ncbi:MAG: Uma2 family endonuclease [Spirochaetaceae bacterium]